MTSTHAALLTVSDMACGGVFTPPDDPRPHTPASNPRKSREHGTSHPTLPQDISKAHALAKKIRAGTIWINCYNVFDASLPFGGYKESGWGREMGHEVLEAYTEVKAVTAQL